MNSVRLVFLGVVAATVGVVASLLGYVCFVQSAHGSKVPLGFVALSWGCMTQHVFGVCGNGRAKHWSTFLLGSVCGTVLLWPGLLPFLPHVQDLLPEKELSEIRVLFFACGWSSIFFSFCHWFESLLVGLFLDSVEPADFLALPTNEEDTEQGNSEEVLRAVIGSGSVIGYCLACILSYILQSNEDAIWMIVLVGIALLLACLLLPKGERQHKEETSTTTKLLIV